MYSDGGSRGNPGPAACAFAVFTADGKELFSYKKFLGVTTNNVAEYKGVLAGVLWLTKQKEKLEDASVTFFLDSELLVKQLKGEYKVKSPHLKPLYEKVKKTVDDLDFPVDYQHVLRDKNKRADALVNAAMDENLY